MTRIASNKCGAAGSVRLSGEKVNEGSRTLARPFRDGFRIRRTRYGCEDTGSGRRLVTVSAVATNVTNDHYQGQRATYTVDSNGFAVPASTTSVSGPRDAAGFQAEPLTCA
jgi:hypothetical protein